MGIGAAAAFCTGQVQVFDPLRADRSVGGGALNTQTDVQLEAVGG